MTSTAKAALLGIAGILLSLQGASAQQQGPPTAQVEVVNPDPIPVVGTVEVIPPASGGNTPVAVTEVPETIVDLLREISSSLASPRVPLGEMSILRCQFCDEDEEKTISFEPDGAAIGSLTVRSVGDRDVAVRVFRGEQVILDLFLTNPQHHFPFPIPFIADRVKLVCTDSSGCPFADLSIAAQPLASP